jgi:hypothetical protein
MNYLIYLTIADCTKRVFCADGVIVKEESCLLGWKFDYLFLSCHDPTFARCFPGETISCTNAENDRSLIPHPSKFILIVYTG